MLPWDVLNPICSSLRLLHSKLSSFLPVTPCMKKEFHSQPPSKRKASGYSLQVLGRFYQHFSIFWGKYRFHKWSSYHFIQWCTVQVTENDGSFNLISAMQFMCAHCTGCAESTSFAKHWGSRYIYICTLLLNVK